MNSQTLLSLVAGLLLLGACSDTTESRRPAAIQLDQATLSLETGQNAAVTATILDQHGQPFITFPSDVSLTWTSSANTVATVSAGVVTGVSAGNASIVASAPGLVSADVQVTVAAAVTYTGQLGFSYSGELSGTFSVSSSFQIHPQEGLPGDNWALSVYYSARQDFAALRTREDGRIDIIHVWSDGPRLTGTGTRSVSGGNIVIGYSPANNSLEGEYWVTGGTIQITSVPQNRVAGTFALQGGEFDDDPDLWVTGGTFDLPVIPGHLLP